MFLKERKDIRFSGLEIQLIQEIIQKDVNADYGSFSGFVRSAVGSFIKYKRDELGMKNDIKLGDWSQ